MKTSTDLSIFQIKMKILASCATLTLAVLPNLHAQTERWTLIAAEGGPVPGIPGATFDEILNSSVNDSGQIAFGGNVEGGGVLPSNSNGLWFGTAAGVGLALRQGQNYIPFTNIGFVNFFDLNNLGQIAVKTDLEGGGPVAATDEAIFMLNNGTLTLAVRKGDLVSPGVTYGDFRNNSLRLNDAGRIAFEASLEDPGDPLERGYFTGLPGSLATVARRGTIAPGTGGMAFGGFGGSESGQANAPNNTISLLASIGATDGIWRRIGGILSLVALEGDATPFPGNTFNGFDETSINAAGTIAFRGTYTDGATFRVGLFQYSQGSITTITRSGAPAPGLAVGITINSIRRPVISPLGRIAFEARIDGPGVAASNDGVFYVQDGSGAFKPLLREGQPIAPGVQPNRIVDSFSCNQHVGYSGKNLLLVRVRFTDGAGASLYLVELGIPETTLRGKAKRKTRKDRFRIRGNAFDDEAISLVQYKVGKKNWRRARGTTSWRKKIKLKTRRTRVFIRAFDTDGNVSTTQRLVIRKR